MFIYFLNFFKLNNLIIKETFILEGVNLNNIIFFQIDYIVFLFLFGLLLVHFLLIFCEIIKDATLNFS